MAQSYDYLGILYLILKYNNNRFENFENTSLVRARASRPNKRGVCKPSLVSRFKPETGRFKLGGS
jgi:hypothetical protein